MEFQAHILRNFESVYEGAKIRVCVVETLEAGQVYFVVTQKKGNKKLLTVVETFPEAEGIRAFDIKVAELSRLIRNESEFAFRLEVVGAIMMRGFSQSVAMERTNTLHKLTIEAKNFNI